MSSWQRYWFAPAPYLDLAIVRWIAVGTQLFIVLVLQWANLEMRAALPDGYWQPLIILQLMHFPLGLEFRPPFAVLEIIYYISIVSGVASLIGLLTNLSLLIFCATSVYLQAFIYSFTDFHHPEAVMMVALAVLALSPSGRVLSVDAWLRGRRTERGGSSSPDRTSQFAGWPLKLIQWFFVLMYASAVWNKLTGSGLDWANGFTLQYYLARDGLRWDSPLAYWLSHHHTLILLAQYGVLVFQVTFVLAVIFPRLRWIYVPAGLALHTFIYLTLTAPFFQWIALYAVFIPWTKAVHLVRSQWGRLPQTMARAD